MIYRIILDGVKRYEEVIFNEYTKENTIKARELIKEHYHDHSLEFVDPIEYDLKLFDINKKLFNISMDLYDVIRLLPHAAFEDCTPKSREDKVADLLKAILSYLSTIDEVDEYLNNKLPCPEVSSYHIECPETIQKELRESTYEFSNLFNYEHIKMYIGTTLNNLIKNLYTNAHKSECGFIISALEGWRSDVNITKLYLNHLISAISDSYVFTSGEQCDWYDYWTDNEIDNAYGVTEWR